MTTLTHKTGKFEVQFKCLVNTKEFRTMFPTILSSSLSDSVLDSLMTLKTGVSKNSYRSEVRDGILQLEFALPGLSKDDISVSSDHNKLVLDIKKSSNWTLEGKSSYIVSDGFNLEGTSAEMKDGVLFVSIPEKSIKKSKSIKIS